jgi:hypothetical protein
MSTIKTNTLQNVAGSKSVPMDTVVDGSAKAWVNFNGTGTVAIRKAFNVSSITDNGTGDYTVNFATPMTDADYSISGFAGGISGNFNLGESTGTARSVSLVRVASFSTANTQTDTPFVSFQAFD